MTGSRRVADANTAASRYRRNCGSPDKPCKVSKRKDSFSLKNDLFKFGMFFLIGLGVGSAIFFISWASAYSTMVANLGDIKDMDPSLIQWWNAFFIEGHSADIWWGGLYYYYPTQFFIFDAVISIVAFFVIWIVFPLFIGD